MDNKDVFRFAYVTGSSHTEKSQLKVCTFYSFVRDFEWAIYCCCGSSHSRANNWDIKIKHIWKRADKKRVKDADNGYIVQKPL